MEERTLRKDDSSEAFNVALKKGGEKERKKTLGHGCSNLVTHPRRTGFNFFEQTIHAVLAVL